MKHPYTTHFIAQIFLPMWSNYMGCQSLLYQIEIRFLQAHFGKSCSNYQAPNWRWVLPTTLKPMVRLRELTNVWKCFLAMLPMILPHIVPNGWIQLSSSIIAAIILLWSVHHLRLSMVLTLIWETIQLLLLVKQVMLPLFFRIDNSIWIWSRLI